MSVQHFDIIRKPFSYREGIVVSSSVTDQQLYDGQNHVPDYNLTPLVLSPYVSVSDQEADVSGNALPQLTNLKWTLVEVGGRKQDIPSAGNSNFSWEKSGENAGRLKVMRNAMPENAMTLVFEADHIDKRTLAVHHVLVSHVVRCRNAALAAPVLMLDAAFQSFYNPLRDKAQQRINVTFSIGGSELSVQEREVSWEVLLTDARNTSGVSYVSWNDSRVKSGMLSVDGQGSLLVQKDKIDKTLTLRCKARKRSGAVWVERIVSITRRIPFLKDPYFTAVPTNVSRQQGYINPRAVVEDTAGIVPNPDAVIEFEWWTQRGTADGGGRWEKHGETTSTPTISTNFIDPIYGGNLRLEWRDKGAKN